MSPEEIAAMREGMKNPPQEIVEPVIEPVIQQVDEPVIPPVVQEVVEPIAEPVVEPIIEKAPEPIVKVKTFDEELVEKFGGKVKSIDEIKAILDAPKEVFIDDEEVRKIYELKKSGVKIDKEFFELNDLKLDLDANNEIDPKYILTESLKRKPETKGYDKEMIDHHIEKKYNLSEWENKEETELTPDDKINRANLMRDAQNDYDWLNNLKKERTLVPQIDPNIAIRQQQKLQQEYEVFDKFVDTNVVAKVTNLSIIIDEKTGEKFEFKVSDADGKEYGSLMKSMVKGEKNLFDQFAYTDSNGVKQLNHEEIFKMLVKNKNFDLAVKNAYNDGKAVGAKKEITELKNSGFPQNQTQSTPKEPASPQEALRAEMRKQILGKS